MDRDIALHLLSCSPKHAWPASNLKRQGWRDFWRMAKSPVERKRNAQAYLALIALFSYVTQSWSLAVKGVLCILGYPHGFRYWIVMCDFFFFIGGWDYSAWSPKQMAACRDSPCRQCSVMRILPLTVIMKGTALIISRMKGTRSTCSQTLPWKHKPHTGVRKLHCLGDLRRLTHNRPSYHKVQGNKLMSFCTIQ